MERKWLTSFSKMTTNEQDVRKWGVDLVICLNRFKAFNSAVKEWIRTAGAIKKNGLMIFDYLALEGNKTINLPRHPYLDYSDVEKLVFEQCFGKPLEVPKKLMINVTLKDFIKVVDERKKLFEECLAYSPQSRFRNFQSTSKKSKSPKRTKKGA